MTRRTIIHRGLSLATLVVACLAASLLSATPADAAGPRPDFRSPWPCGEQRQYYHHSSEVLNALDFSLPGGADFNTPVLAPAAGTVEVVHGHAGYGNYVRIHHTGGWASMMAHLHTTSVADGQYVQVGQEIGRVGSTGNSTGPHLHLEQEADGTNHPIILDGVALRYSGAVSHHTSRNCGGSGVSGQAFVFGGSQRFAGVDVSGSLTNFSWSPGTGVVRSDWGGGAVTGVPVGYVHDGLQHVFARGTDDTLRHWYQSGTHPPGLDSWNTTGLVKSDPAGFAYGTQQHVFFRNPQNRLEHRYYDTTTGQVHGGVWSDHTFTGNPYAFVHRDQQHVFARTAEGAL
ncbi:peptidoglycan DD-metalloendopeptidase family protein, partial [Stackebrandtia albiflava]|uniref:peptidoglycan DD-metalloendopeptidase family protein n=1 Tax=Stackebrandtia albiflava TaxID=406432 RepID=UPI0031EC3737